MANDTKTIDNKKASLTKDLEEKICHSLKIKLKALQLDLILWINFYLGDLNLNML